MECPCIPCSSRYEGQIQRMPVATSRLEEIARDVWLMIFRELNLKDKLVCSMTCKRWRNIISKSKLLHPYYNIGTFQCFKPFRKDFLKSRHFIILDTTGSMLDEKKKRIKNGAQIIRKLIDFSEPVIKTKGIFVGYWNEKVDVTHVKTEAAVIDYFNNLSFSPGITVFDAIPKAIDEKLQTLKSIPTHVHVITDTELIKVTPFFSYSFNSKVIFHFFNVTRNARQVLLSNIIEDSQTEVDPYEPENKKQKLKNPVEISLHPLERSPLGPLLQKGS